MKRTSDVPGTPVPLLALALLATLHAGCAAAIVGGAAAGGAVAGAAAADPERDAGDVVSDAAITAQVKAKLAASPLTRAIAIDVDTRRGIVTLSGDVRSGEEMREALRLAAEVAGDGRVRNRLRIPAA